MHQSRAETIRAAPIARKGTQYIARPANHASRGVSVVMALRDMLKLARTSKEVEMMVRAKGIKLNGRVVKNLHESVKLFNILEADQKYSLELLPTGRFIFEPTKSSSRLCKIIGKKVLNHGVMQYNLHDGTNFISKEKHSVGETVEVDLENKVKKVHKMEKGKQIFVFDGRSAGQKGTIHNIEGRKIDVKFENRSVTLDSRHVMVI